MTESTQRTLVLSVVYPTLGVLALGFAALLMQFATAARRDTARTLQEFRTQERKLAAAYQLIDILPGGVSIVSQDGRIEYVNEGFEEISGRNRRELVGMSVLDLMPDEHRTKHITMFNDRQLLRQMAGSAFCLPHGQMFRPDKVVINCEIRIAPHNVSEQPQWLVFIDPTTVRPAAVQSTPD